jgi:hypothetical protein
MEKRERELCACRGATQQEVEGCFQELIRTRFFSSEWVWESWDSRPVLAV